MKTLLKISILIFLSFALKSHSQTIKNSTKIKTQTSLVNNKLNSEKVKLKKNINALQNVSFVKSDLIKIPTSKAISIADAEKNRVKKWEISPKKPIVSGMAIAFNGYYSENGFLISPREIPNTRTFYLYSAFISTSIRAGKNYNFSFEIDPNSLPNEYHEIIIEIGQERFRIILQKNQSTYIIPFQFTSDRDWAIYNSIAISGAINLQNREDMKPILLKKIQLEELE